MDLKEKIQMLFVQAAGLVTALYALVWSGLRLKESEPLKISYGPMSNRDEERQANLTLIYNSNDVECVNMIRMRRAPFFQLCNLLRSRNLLRDSIHTSIEEQVAMFLHVVGHNQRFRVIHQNWRRSVEIVSRYFKEVMYVIGELRNDMIKPPSGDTPPKIRNSHRWYPYFKVTELCHLMLLKKCLEGAYVVTSYVGFHVGLCGSNRWNSYQC
jgi:hypothetical protein